MLQEVVHASVPTFPTDCKRNFFSIKAKDAGPKLMRGAAPDRYLCASRSKTQEDYSVELERSTLWAHIRDAGGCLVMLKLSDGAYSGRKRDPAEG